MRPTPTSNRAAQAYQRAATTVPPLTAVVMLYDGAILSIKRAAAAVEAERFEESFGQLTRATTILNGLAVELDLGAGGGLAERLKTTYLRNTLALLRSVGKPDAAARFRRVAGGLADLRDAWATIAGLPLRGREETMQRQMVNTEGDKMTATRA